MCTLYMHMYMYIHETDTQEKEYVDMNFLSTSPENTWSCDLAVSIRVQCRLMLHANLIPTHSIYVCTAAGQLSSHPTEDCRGSICYVANATAHTHQLHTMYMYIHTYNV